MCNYFVEKAENATLWDIEGNEVIDFAAGIAVLNTGHRHPKVVAAVADQPQAFTHTAYQIVPYEAMFRWRSVSTIWRQLTGRQNGFLHHRRGGGRERGENRPRLHRSSGADYLRRRFPRPYLWRPWPSPVRSRPTKSASGRSWLGVSRRLPQCGAWRDHRGCAEKPGAHFQSGYCAGPGSGHHSRADPGKAALTSRRPILCRRCATCAIPTAFC